MGQRSKLSQRTKTYSTFSGPKNASGGNIVLLVCYAIQIITLEQNAKTSGTVVFVRPSG